MGAADPVVPGTVYWITGLTAAGKTTIATRLCERLRSSGRPAVLLDGDRLRQVLDAGLAYAPARPTRRPTGCAWR